MSHTPVAGALIPQPSMPRAKLSFAMPAGACDCHTHVFGPYAQFPLVAGRTYTPPEASQAQLAALMDALGLRRVVIVQPSVYGVDNTATIAGVRAFNENARAVAVIDESFSAGQLAELHSGGVRGIRINLLTVEEPAPSEAAGLVLRMAEKIAPMGWHIQLFIRLGLIAAMRETLMALPVDVVIDHFGWAHVASSDAADVQALCALVEGGNAYVKLSAAYRIADQGFDDVRVAALARRFIAANSERMLWGSDWPHPVPFTEGRAPALHDVDDGAALNALAAWAGDEAMLKRILVDNPARLYGFA